jgi:translation elongation factor EF-1alpha
MVCTAPVDCGKSTISGHLLYKLNVFSTDEFRIAEKKAIDNKMPTWKYAYLLDVMEEEQIHGKTKDYCEYSFEYNEKKYLIVDTPGHQQLVRNMINGCSSVDIGLFVVSCKSNEYQNCLNDIEHLAILKCLGAQYIVVLLNKWDIKDDTLSLDTIQHQVKMILKKSGFKHVYFCCTSGYLGYNLVTNDNTYPTQCLMNVIDSISVHRKELVSYKTNKLVLSGVVIGTKLLTAGYSLVVHGGGTNKEFQVDIDSILPKCFARPNEKCTITINLQFEEIFTNNRFILRDANETLFIGVN